jgi:enamine deaminase RidA (YjgF/YER057c/UK114 family)
MDGDVTPEERLVRLGIELQPATNIPRSGTGFRTWRVSGRMLYVSGHGPARDSQVAVGKLGRDLDENQGYEAAREAAINVLATMRSALGSLDRVHQLVKLLGMVNATEDFVRQSHVINGASDLLVEVFGEAGLHARSAVGMQSLPNGMPVEIELIAEIDGA